MGLCIGAFLVVWVIADNLFVGLVAGLIGAYLPFFAVTSKRAKRQKMIAIQIPEALDFLSRILRSGSQFDDRSADDGRGTAATHRDGIPPLL